MAESTARKALAKTVVNKAAVEPRKPEPYLAMVRRARRIDRELAELHP